MRKTPLRSRYAIKLVEVADGYLESVGQLVEVGRVDYQIHVLQKRRVQVHRAHPGHNVNKKQSAALSRAHQLDLAGYESHTLFDGIEIGVDNHDIHAFLAHSPEGLIYVLGHKDVIVGE